METNRQTEKQTGRRTDNYRIEQKNKEHRRAYDNIKELRRTGRDNTARPENTENSLGFSSRCAAESRAEAKQEQKKHKNRRSESSSKSSRSRRRRRRRRRRRKRRRRRR
jgi:hypothetical protein